MASFTNRSSQDPCPDCEGTGRIKVGFGLCPGCSGDGRRHVWHPPAQIGGAQNGVSIAASQGVKEEKQEPGHYVYD